MKPNPIVEKSFDFAILIVEFSEKLIAARHYKLAEQVFKAGTSIGANVRESQNAESRRDFIHKLKIAAKEADETMFWLELCERSTHLADPPDSLKSLLLEIKKMLSSIISSSKRNS